MGDALGNAGYITRGVFENVGYNEINLSRGSDANQYLATPSNWGYRRQLLTLATPSFVINQNICNDVSASTNWYAGNWAANTAFAQYSVISPNSNFYLAIQGGTSGSTKPSGTGQAIQDGTVVWAYIMPYTSAKNPASVVFAYLANVNAQIKAALPAAPLIQVTCIPNVSDSNSVSSLTSSGTTATAAVASTAALSNGESVIISGASPSAYNGMYAITVVDGTHFSYTFAGGTSPATGTITFSDSYASTALQTPNSGWGGSTSTRGVIELVH